MDDDNRLDGVSPEPLEPSSHQPERTTSMLSEPPATGDDISTINGDVEAPNGPPPPPQVDPNAKIVHEVVNSEARQTPGDAINLGD